MGMTDMALTKGRTAATGPSAAPSGRTPRGDLAPPRAQVVDVGRPRSGLARRRGAPVDAFRQSLHDRHDRGLVC